MTTFCSAPRTDRSLLENALKDVLKASYDPQREWGDRDWLRDSAICLILNAYEGGIRDQKTLAHNAMRIMGFETTH
jgi:hypothetical protein